MIVVGGRNTTARKAVSRDTYRVMVALWVFLWLAIAAGIGLYVFESWWMVGLGSGIVLVLISGLLSNTVHICYGCFHSCCWWDDIYKFDPNDPSRPEYDH